MAARIAYLCVNGIHLELKKLALITATSQIAHLMSTSPGVYAILLGSGVSRGAGIPTGWDVTVDLISRLARLRDEEPVPTPEDWYRATTGAEPAYSEIIELLAPKGDERRSLLNGYFEPNAEEREQGLKQPGPAHRAIARLVTGGFVRVILTTNFDRLMERALEEVGVSPVIIKSEDDLRGAIPVVHARCVLVKLHGDYLDVRFKNTVDELGSYDGSMETYVSRILDDFGLVVCGWSSDWDGALRKLVCSGAGRRYGAFWCANGTPSAGAQSTIADCGAKLVEIENADSFFQDLADRVEAISQFGGRDAMSIDQIVSMVKLYSSEPKYRTRLADLYSAEVDVAAAAIRSADLRSADSAEDFRRVVTELDASTSTLRAALAAGVATDIEETSAPYVRPIVLLHDRLKRVTANTRQPLLNLEWLPISELFYTVGVVALWRGSFSTIRHLFDLQFPGEYTEENSAIDLLPAVKVGGLDKHHWQRLEGKERQYLPLNEHLAELLEPDAMRVGFTSEEWVRSFNRFELLLTLAHGFRRESSWGFWGPPGRYAYRHGRGAADDLGWLTQEGASGAKSAMLKAGLFGGDSAAFDANLAQFNKWLPELSKHFW